MNPREKKPVMVGARGAADDLLQMEQRRSRPAASRPPRLAFLSTGNSGHFSEVLLIDTGRPQIQPLDTDHNGKGTGEEALTLT